MRLAAKASTAALALLVAVGIFATAPSQAQDEGPTTTTVATGEPTLRTERGIYRRGESIRITGRNWPTRSVVTVELCGNEARSGTVDCDTRNAQTSAIGRDGELRAQLLAAAPPAPCPCVVRVYVPGGTVDLAIRVEIEGVPFAELSEETGPRRELTVRSARLTGGGGVGAWFGLPPTRTLVLRIENTGEVAVPKASLRAGWGRSSDPSRPIDLADLERLEPGESVIVTEDVTFGPLSVGQYVVSGQIAGFEDARFQASASSYPYGLLLVGLLIVLWIGSSLYRRGTDEGVEADGVADPRADDESAEMTGTDDSTD